MSFGEREISRDMSIKPKLKYCGPFCKHTESNEAVCTKMRVKAFAIFAINPATSLFHTLFAGSSIKTKIEIKNSYIFNVFFVLRHIIYFNVNSKTLGVAFKNTFTGK